MMMSALRVFEFNIIMFIRFWSG